MNNISDYEAHKRDEEWDAAEDRRKARVAMTKPNKYKQQAIDLLNKEISEKSNRLNQVNLEKIIVRECALRLEAEELISRMERSVTGKDMTSDELDEWLRDVEALRGSR